VTFGDANAEIHTMDIELELVSVFLSWSPSQYPVPDVLVTMASYSESS
jgi:hypothetical protein